MQQKTEKKVNHENTKNYLLHYRPFTTEAGLFLTKEIQKNLQKYTRENRFKVYMYLPHAIEIETIYPKLTDYFTEQTVKENAKAVQAWLQRHCEIPYHYNSAEN